MATVWLTEQNAAITGFRFVEYYLLFPFHKPGYVPCKKLDLSFVWCPAFSPNYLALRRCRIQEIICISCSSGSTEDTPLYDGGKS